MARVAPPSRKSPALRWRWLLPVAALVVAFHFSPFSRDLDWSFFDAASRRPLRLPPLPPDSAIVMLDDTTMDLIGRDPYDFRWPLRRAVYGALLVGLERAGAKKIVVDFTFFDQSESPDDQELLGAIAAASPGVVLARTVKQAPVFWPDEYVQAHPGFFARRRTGNADSFPDADGITRRYKVQESLAAAALDSPPVQSVGLLRWQGGLEQIRARGIPVVPAARFIIPGVPFVQQLQDFSPESIALKLAKEPPLSDEAADRVRGRTVFVGANANGTFDRKPTPVGGLEPGVIIHWTAWANLMADGFITVVPPAGIFLGALLLAGAVIWAGRRHLAVLAPVATAAGLSALLLLGSYVALSYDWYLPPATPLVAIGLTLLGIVIESYWLEQARKREIQSMFGAYVDPTVVAQLVRDPDSIRLKGERREATVFFSDLVGFTDLSEKLKDQTEQMVTVVNAYLEAVSDCALNHGGYVDKYIGDSVMAVFGAPQSLPDHAMAACLAALAARKTLPALNADYAAAAGVRLEMRIGLGTGELIMGNVGSSRKKNYTVMGDTVNLASRLEGANKAFHTHILLDDATAKLVAGRLATRPLARLRVKGKHQAVEVHALLGLPAELSAAEREFLASYRAGYDAYVNGRFAEAELALGRADGILPGDLTTVRLREESRQFSLHPPPAGWEPILILESK